MFNRVRYYIQFTVRCIRAQYLSPIIHDTGLNDVVVYGVLYTIIHDWTYIVFLRWYPLSHTATNTQSVNNSIGQGLHSVLVAWSCG